jgi:hypothetical protein
MRAKMIVSILALTMLSGVMYFVAKDNEEMRKNSRKMAAQTLQDLSKLEPTSQAAIQNSAGYAVCSWLRHRRPHQEQARNLHEDGIGRSWRNIARTTLIRRDCRYTRWT